MPSLLRRGRSNVRLGRAFPLRLLALSLVYIVCEGSGVLAPDPAREEDFDEKKEIVE